MCSDLFLFVFSGRQSCLFLELPHKMCCVLISARGGNFVDAQVSCCQELFCHPDTRFKQVVDIADAKMFLIELLHIAFAYIQPLCQLCKAPVKFGSFVYFAAEHFKLTDTDKAFALWLAVVKFIPQCRDARFGRSSHISAYIVGFRQKSYSRALLHFPYQHLKLYHKLFGILFGSGSLCKRKNDSECALVEACSLHFSS